ncbi:hypothetical protein OIV83_001845 [Microbotryomycetes sp. JL201]|nr:hypothetical protein OIV83_001845 [Microbotryomycetes sp. JL201]
MTRFDIDFSRLPNSHRPPDYHVSALLRGHTDDVRSLACDPFGRLYSASRDGTARQWTREQQTHSNDDKATNESWRQTGEWTEYHDGFVNCIAWLPWHNGMSSSDKPETGSGVPTHSGTLRPGFLVTGGQDALIQVHQLQKTEFVLTEHKAAVWATLAIDVPKFDDCCITACADGLVRLFREARLATVFKGHQGPVRALAKIMPDDRHGNLFASASNDGSIRIWSLDGDAVTVLDGHLDSFIYSLCSISTVAGGGLASGGEEGIVKVWNDEDGEQDQEIIVPALSVWCIVALGNGDLACACSDDLIWIFTRDGDRAADVATRVEYDQMIAGRARAKQGLPLQEAEVPTEISLGEPGTHDGQVRIAKASDGSAHAFQWSSPSKKWVDVGQVVQGSEANQPSKSVSRMKHEGVEYDYVFSIDVADDQPPLSLPFNTEQGESA